jgi:peptidyl-tRNA hydrolase
MKKMTNDIVQYIVVRKDLKEKYGIANLAVQICHAGMAPITSRIKRAPPETPVNKVFDTETYKWIHGIFTKRLLQAEPSALDQLCERLESDGIRFNRINESGLGGILTCIGVKPYPAGKVAKYFKNLELLK